MLLRLKQLKISTYGIWACIVIALTIAENLAFWGNMRFRAPIEPLLVLLAGGVLWWFTDDEPARLRYWRKQKRGNTREEASGPLKT